jgi:Raf kinase inhibitor-like YbhB/YbcL family protein
MAFQFHSGSFDPGGTIPTRHTCDGPDTSPDLRWGKPPDGTESFALIAEDPDAPAGTWVHWVLYDLPATNREIPENIPKERDLTTGARQGRNDFGRIGYGGPCPPPGPPHRYVFRLYCLDRKLNLHAGATKAELEAAMEGHVLAEAKLVGKYGRS